MGWEAREGTDWLYYTRSERVGGRVVRTYLGRGPESVLLAAAFAELAEENARLRGRARRRKEVLRGTVAKMDTGAARTDPLLHALLIAAGYHRHKREWRKRRQGGAKEMTTALTTTAIPTELTVTPTREQVIEFAQRAESGDNAALSRLRAALRHPGIVHAFSPGPSRQTQDYHRRSKQFRDVLAREEYAAQLEALRGELAGPHPGPLEMLFVERVVTDLLLLNSVESMFAVDHERKLITHKDYQAALQRAHGRYLSSLKALARFRSLMLTAPTKRVEVTTTTTKLVTSKGGGAPERE